MGDFGKTLVVTGGGLGDTLFHLPFIRSIQAKASGGAVTLACKKGREIAELFSEVDFIDGVIPLAKNQDVSGKVDLRRFHRALRDQRIETAFIFHKSTGISFASLTAGVKNRFGYYFKGGKNRFFLNRGLEVPKDVALPAFMTHAALLMDDARLAYDYSDVRFRQPEHVVEAAFASLDLAQYPSMGRPRMIALGINSSAAFKQWGAENYAALAERLFARFDGKILLFGAGDVRHVAQGILDRCGQPQRFIDLTTRKIPLHHSHALLQSCDLYVGNDSFGLNLAAMSSIPAVGIFIRSYHFSYSDWIKPVVAESDEIESIAPANVWQAVEPLLAVAA